MTLYSNEIAALRDASLILDKAKKQAASEPMPVWSKLTHALRHIEQQLSEAIEQ